jgi:hypothetical protein
MALFKCSSNHPDDHHRYFIAQGSHLLISRSWHYRAHRQFWPIFDSNHQNLLTLASGLILELIPHGVSFAIRNL